VFSVMQVLKEVKFGVGSRISSGGNQSVRIVSPPCEAQETVRVVRS